MKSYEFNIPIIPIPDVVFFPHTSIPLIIEEPIYIRMVKERANEGKWIGISLARENVVDGQQIIKKYSPEAVFSVGKPIILDENEEGLRVIIKGIVRMELIEVVQNLPYLIFRAQTLPDHDNQVTEVGSNTIERLTILLDQWVLENIENSLERDYFYESLKSLHHTIDYICLLMIPDEYARQFLLEKTSLHERIIILDSILKDDFLVQNSLIVTNAFIDYENIEKTQKLAH